MVAGRSRCSLHFSRAGVGGQVRSGTGFLGTGCVVRRYRPPGGCAVKTLPLRGLRAVLMACGPSPPPGGVGGGLARGRRGVRQCRARGVPGGLDARGAGPVRHRSAQSRATAGPGHRRAVSGTRPPAGARQQAPAFLPGDSPWPGTPPRRRWGGVCSAVPGARCPVPGARCPVPGARCPVPGAGRSCSVRCPGGWGRAVWCGLRWGRSVWCGEQLHVPPDGVCFPCNCAAWTRDRLLRQGGTAARQYGCTAARRQDSTAARLQGGKTVRLHGCTAAWCRAVR